MEDKLTIKQEKFAQSVAHKEFDYIWEAYAAHYNVPKMSRNSLYQESCRLLSHPKVSSRVKELEGEIVSQSQSTLDEILTMMSKRARLDIRDFFTIEGEFKPIHQLTFDQASLLESFNVEEIWSRGKDPAQIGLLKRVKFVGIEKIWDMFMKKYGAYIKVVKNESGDLDHLADILHEIQSVNKKL